MSRKGAKNTKKNEEQQSYKNRDRKDTATRPRHAADHIFFLIVI